MSAILRAVGPRLTLDRAALEQLAAEHSLRTRTYPSGLSAFDDDDDSFDQPSPNRGKRPYKLTDAGVAVIPISGVLLTKGSWMSAMSGCSSYDQIQSAITCAVDDRSVTGILLD